MKAKGFVDRESGIAYKLLSFFASVVSPTHLYISRMLKKVFYVSP